MSEAQETYTATPGATTTTPDTHPTEQKKPGRGGARQGAGRPPFSPTGRRKRRVFIASDAEWEKVVEKAALAGFPNVSEYIRSKIL
jgi:hypothetical protein